jgi:hypothetical protein
MALTPTTIQGSRLVTNINSADIVRDVSPDVLMLQDDRKNLMTNLKGLKQETKTNSQFEWLTDEIVANRGTTTASAVAPTASGAGTTTASLAVLGASTAAIQLNIDDVIRIPATGEVMRVTAVPTAMNAVPVKRNLTGNTPTGTSTAGEIPSGALWIKVGDARAGNSRLYSGDTLQSIGSLNATAYNYTQTFREPVGHSRRELGTKLYSGDAGNTEKAKALMVHCQKIEHAIVLGERLDEGSERTHTGGLNYWVTANGQTSAVGSGILSQSVFDEFNRVVTRWGNRQNRVLFCSRRVASLISSWAYSGSRVTNLGGAIKYGVNVENIRTAQGTNVEIITSDVLEGLSGSTATGTYDGYAYLLDTAGKGLATFNGDYMKYAENVQLPDMDGKADAFLSDVGFIPGDTRKDGLLTGVTAIA